jgi:predicted N-acetyltransferase YhbS
MGTSLRPPREEDADELGRILFDAFAGVAAAYGYRSNVPDISVATAEIWRLLRSPHHYGVIAEADARPVGSNFISFMDEVAGLGPVTVDPRLQGRGIGRSLMLDVLREARARGWSRVRLQADAPNMGSLGLYTSVGFNVKEPTIVLSAGPDATGSDHRIRDARPSDVSSLTAICRRTHTVSRTQEIRAALGDGRGVLVRTHGGEITGYLIPTVLGHGAATDPADIADLAVVAARRRGAENRMLCFQKHTDLLRYLRSRGFTFVKAMSLMAIGRWDPPRRYAIPSISY